MYKIMAIDDDKFILATLQRTLRQQSDWQVDTFHSPFEALKQAEKSDYDLFLTDYQMPGMNGIQFLSKILILQPDSMRIILSGQNDLDLVLKAVKEADIYRFICKPVQKHELVATINQALQFYETLAENKRLIEQVAMQQVELDKRKRALDKIKADNPGAVELSWSVDGSIILEA